MAANVAILDDEEEVVTITRKIKRTKGTVRRTCHCCGNEKDIPASSYVYKDGTALCKDCSKKEERPEHSLAGFSTHSFLKRRQKVML